MATRRWGISKGENIGQVTEAVGAAVATDSMEFTIDLAANLTKEQVVLGLECITQAIMKDQWPPA
jgi:hypothetical protein